MRGSVSRWFILLAASISLHASGARPAESVHKVTLRGVVIRVGDSKRKIFDAIGNDFLVGEKKSADFRLQREHYRVDGRSITFDYEYPLTITSIIVDDDLSIRTHTERPLCASSTLAGNSGHRASGWYNYRGRLAGQKVSLYLRMTDGDRIDGVYEYEKFHKPVRVIAYISQNGREIQIDELNEEARTGASFWGQFRPWKSWSSPNLSCDWIVGVWRRTGTSDTDLLHEGGAFQAFDLSLRSLGWEPPESLRLLVPGESAR